MSEPRRRPTVDRLDEDVRAISDTVDDIKETLDQHTVTLERHGTILDQHTVTLEHHGTILDQHTVILGDIRDAQRDQGELLVEILRRLDAG